MRLPYATRRRNHRRGRPAESAPSSTHAPGLIRIRVSDGGPGIAPEHLPHLFERFFRADRGRTRAQGGSGLGLSIAQTIVQSHGGQLTVASELGSGSTFTATLPQA
ncbi:MAG: ATP-binding protein [Kouleothrix sp.]